MTQTASPDDLMAAGLFGACCFLFSLVAIIGVLIWMFRGRGAAPAMQQPPPMQPMMQQAGDFHLSVIALGFDAYFRPQVEAMVAGVTNTTDPVAARVELIQRAARGLLGVEPQWRYFGYGEKELNQLPAAQQSFSSAVADFRDRGLRGSDGGVLAVLTIVLCTRGRRLGVDRLDTRQQVHELLNDRLRLDAATLLGADVVWAPPSGGLTDNAIRKRFPEMHALNG